MSERVKLGIMPSTNYQSGAKQKYRNEIWSELSRYYKPGTIAVIMPARGCEEIEVAISYGVKEEDIFCFDASAAVIATSKWRKKYPNIMFAACSLGKLSDKIEKLKKPVSVANFDLCGNVAGDSVDEVDGFLCSGVMLQKCAFAINIAKGREGRTLLRVLKSLNAAKNIDCDRMIAFCSISRFFVDGSKDLDPIIISCKKQGNYRENKTPMTWAVFRAKKFFRFQHRPNFIERAKNLRDRGLRSDFVRLIDLAHKAMQIVADGSVNNPDLYRMQERFAHTMARCVPLDADFMK